MESDDDTESVEELIEEIEIAEAVKDAPRHVRTGALAVLASYLGLEKEAKMLMASTVDNAATELEIEGSLGREEDDDEA